MGCFYPKPGLELVLVEWLSIDPVLGIGEFLGFILTIPIWYGLVYSATDFLPTVKNMQRTWSTTCSLDVVLRLFRIWAYGLDLLYHLKI